MRKFIGIVLLLALLGGAGGLAWWLTHPQREATELVLYGNVDLRQAQLAFNNSERIAKVNVEEGARVKEGDCLAELDTGRLKPMVDQAEAQIAEQQAVCDRLRGSRPEEKDQAKANVESAQADEVNARRQFDRLKQGETITLKDQKVVRAVSQEDFDKAKAAYDVARAKLVVSQKALILMEKGPRQEERDEAAAKLRAYQANLAFLKQQLADARLIAPSNAVVRTRLMEKGEMATPQKAVFSLAILDPKWVRAYVPEADLGKVRENMTAFATTDSFPNKKYEGWIGFISPVAEFTPKSVQTVELRTSLVFEVRVIVKDPDNELRLGMPATVHVPLSK